MIIEAQISAPSEPTASRISQQLVNKRLVAGTRITEGKSHYWWDDKIKEETYWSINAYTLPKNKQQILNFIKEIHPDDTPIITFQELSGNDEFETWVKETVVLEK